jgi:hypothetical protein
LGWVTLIASAMLIVFASQASAADPFTIQSAVSPEPVIRGETVTDTFTITTTPCADCATTYDFDMLLLRSRSDKPAANPFLSVTSSHGTCSIDPVDSYGYHTATCHLGARQDIPQTVQITAEIQANESMDDFAGMIESGFYSIGIVANALTHVLYPPDLSGSERIQLQGLPTGCAAGDLTIKAHVKADVAHIVATLAGPKDEYGGHQGVGNSIIRKVAHGEGSTLKAKIKASKLEPGFFYNLTFVATSKGQPAIKRAVTFQVCPAEVPG